MNEITIKLGWDGSGIVLGFIVLWQEGHMKSESSNCILLNFVQDNCYLYDTFILFTLQTVSEVMKRLMKFLLYLVSLLILYILFIYPAIVQNIQWMAVHF